MEGVRLLPWKAVLAQMKRSRFWNNCDECKRNPGVRQARMRCGWLQPSQWEGKPNDLVTEISVLQADIMRPSVCPGYSTTLPEVYETARAWGWWEKSQLALKYPEASVKLMDLVELFNQSKAAAEQWMLQEKLK